MIFLLILITCCGEMIKETRSEKSSGGSGNSNMEYLSSVFGPSNQAHVDEKPVTGGGLRFFFNSLISWQLIFVLLFKYFVI